MDAVLVFSISCCFSVDFSGMRGNGWAPIVVGRGGGGGMPWDGEEGNGGGGGGMPGAFQMSVALQFASADLMM